MAVAELPSNTGTEGSLFTRRRVIGTAIRGLAVIALNVPIIRAVDVATTKIEPAIEAAKASFPDPTPPDTSPELRQVATEENDLIYRRNVIEGTTNRIDRSRSTDMPPSGDILRKAWEEDKAAKIQAINEEIGHLQQSPRYRGAINGYTRDQQSFKQSIVDARVNRGNEQSRLEDEAGVTILDRLAHGFGKSSANTLLMISTYFALAIPIPLRRPSWPLPEESKPTTPIADTTISSS